MVKIECNICKNIMFSCNHKDKFIIKPSLIVCKDCQNKGELIPQLMSKYSLVQKQKTIRERVHQQVILPKEELNEQFIFTLLLSQNVRRLVNRFGALKDKILSEEPSMNKKVQKSIQNIRKITERQVTNIITTETKELSAFIEKYDQANQSSINRVEQFRYYVRDRIKQLRQQGNDGEEGLPIFDIQEINQSIQVLNKKINFINTKHISISELINDARNIFTYGQQ